MTRQLTAIAASVAVLVAGLVAPGSIAWLLVIAGLAAAMCLAFAAQRLEPDQYAPWQLIAFGQLLNGLGNMVIAFDTQRWVTAPDWVSSFVFNSATIVTVMGVMGLCLGQESRRLFRVALDLLVITGCALVMGVMWDLGRFFGQPAGEAEGLLGLMGFLAVVVEFIGLGFGVVALLAQPRGHRMANRLAVLALASATLGDSEMLGSYFGLPFEVISLTWLASSLFLLVASAYLRDVVEPVRWISPNTLSRVAFAFVAAQLLSMAFTAVPSGEVRVILVVVLVVAALRVIVPAPQDLTTPA